jgi:hypothetical protein
MLESLKNAKAILQLYSNLINITKNTISSIKNNVLQKKKILATSSQNDLRSDISKWKILIFKEQNQNNTNLIPILTATRKDFCIYRK